MTLSLLDAYDTLTVTQAIAERLAAATARLGKTKGHADEKAWLAIAEAKLSALRGVHAPLLRRAASLPELEVVRGDFADSLQSQAVDAVEKLFAGITFHAGSRSPVLEVLAAKLKLPQLRRADTEDFAKFCTDFEKRLNGSYLKRQLAADEFAFARPVVEQVRTAFAEWRQAFTPEPLPETEQAEIAKALRTAAKEVELPLKQARLLAEAALAPLDGAYEEAGLNVKPKKRSAAKKTEAAAVEAVEPTEPTEVEAAAQEAEVAAEVLEAAPAPAPVEAAPVEAPKAKKPTKKKKSAEAAPAEQAPAE